MPGGQVEVLHSQDNGYFYIPLASIIMAVMFCNKVEVFLEALKKTHFFERVSSCMVSIYVL